VIRLDRSLEAQIDDEGEGGLAALFGEGDR
jgi:hypothetical protein